MESLSAHLYSSEGKKIDTLKLDASVYGGEINTAVLHQYVNAFLSSQRKGLACVKKRGEVSGGGKKPWRQKGTGRARVGSSRNPLWRHGGVTFGPLPRDFSFDIPQKIKSLALCSALKAKVKNDDLLVLDKLSIERPKTKEALNILKNLKLDGSKKDSGISVLLLIAEKNNDIKRSFSNLNFLNISYPKSTNAYEVLSHTKLVLTRDALDILTKRLQS